MNALNIPSENELLTSFQALARQVEPIARCVSALQSGQFVHPDGRKDDLGDVRFGLAKAALISHLSGLCPTPLSIEIGFGMGSSAAIILGTRRFINRPFEHLIFDPYGLPNGRGTVVQAYLKAQYGDEFKRIAKPSEIGLGQLLDERGRSKAGLIFIDGGHRYEDVMIDFVLSDKLCCEGGYIIFDDAWFPAIETVIAYIKNNREDYLLAHLPVPNASVIKKIAPDRRNWCSFKPFRVPERHDWEPVVAPK
jgi:hypothetical protein